MHQVTAGVEFTGDYAITPFDLIYMNRARNVSGWLWAEKRFVFPVKINLCACFCQKSGPGFMTKMTTISTKTVSARTVSFSSDLIIAVWNTAQIENHMNHDLLLWPVPFSYVLNPKTHKNR